MTPGAASGGGVPRGASGGGDPGPSGGGDPGPSGGGAGGTTHGADAPRALALTGRPGIGKTTAIRKAVGRLEELRIAGFYTEEMRASGRRVGFRAVTFGGQQRTIAHVDIDGPRISRYGIDTAAIDDLARTELIPGNDLSAPEGGVDLTVVDEIGKMECLSEPFVKAVADLLDSDALLLATVGRGGGGLMREVRRREDVEVWTVRRENRDALPGRIEAWVRARLRNR